MACKRAGEAATKNGIAELAKRVPQNQLLKFKDFQAKHAEYRARVNKLPEKLPGVDWEYYKRYVRADFVKMVEEFEQKYKSVCEAFHNRHQENTSNYFVEIDKLKQQVQHEFDQYKAASNERIKALEARYAQIKALIPYEEMTAEEYAELLPEKSFYRFNGQPSFWPHTPEEQGPGPSVKAEEGRERQVGGHDGHDGDGSSDPAGSGGSSGGGTTQQSTAKSQYHSVAASPNEQSTTSPPATKTEVVKSQSAIVEMPTCFESTQFKKNLDNLKQYLESTAEQPVGCEIPNPTNQANNEHRLDPQQVEQICNDAVAAIKITQDKIAAGKSKTNILEKANEKFESDLPDLSKCLEEFTIKAGNKESSSFPNSSKFTPFAPNTGSNVKVTAASENAEIERLNSEAVCSMPVKVFSPTAALSKPNIFERECEFAELKAKAAVTETKYAVVKPIQLLEGEFDATKDLQQNSMKSAHDLSVDFVSEFKAFEPNKLLSKTAAEIAAQAELLSVIEKLEHKLNMKQVNEGTKVRQASQKVHETLKLFETKVVGLFENAAKPTTATKSSHDIADLTPKAERQNIVTFPAEKPKVMEAKETAKPTEAPLNNELKKAKSIEVRTSHVEALKHIKSHEETILDADSKPAHLKTLKVIEPHLKHSSKQTTTEAQNETFRNVQHEALEALKLDASKVVSTPKSANINPTTSTETLQAVKPEEVIGGESIREITLTRFDIEAVKSKEIIDHKTGKESALTSTDVKVQNSQLSIVSTNKSVEIQTPTKEATKSATPNVQKIEKTATSVKSVSSTDFNVKKHSVSIATTAESSKNDALQTRKETATSQLVHVSESKGLIKKLDEKTIRSSQRHKQAGVLNPKAECTRINQKLADGSIAIETQLAAAVPAELDAKAVIKRQNEKVQTKSDIKIEPKSKPADSSTEKAFFTESTGAKTDTSYTKLNAVAPNNKTIRQAATKFNTTTAIVIALPEKPICPTCKPRPATATKSTQAIALCEPVQSASKPASLQSKMKAAENTHLEGSLKSKTDLTVPEIKSKPLEAMQTKTGTSTASKHETSQPTATTKPPNDCLRLNAPKSVNAETNKLPQNASLQSKVESTENLEKKSTMKLAETRTKSTTDTATPTKATTKTGSEQTNQAKENPAKENPAKVNLKSKAAEKNIAEVDSDPAKIATTGFVMVGTTLKSNPLVPSELPAQVKALTERSNITAETKTKNPNTLSSSTPSKETPTENTKLVVLQTAKGELLEPNVKSTSTIDNKAVALQTTKSELLETNMKSTSTKGNKPVELQATKGEQLVPTKDNKPVELQGTKIELLEPKKKSTSTKDNRAVELKASRDKLLESTMKSAVGETSSQATLSKHVESKVQLQKPSIDNAANSNLTKTLAGDFKNKLASKKQPNLTTESVLYVADLDTKSPAVAARVEQTDDSAADSKSKEVPQKLPDAGTTKSTLAVNMKHKLTSKKEQQLTAENVIIKNAAAKEIPTLPNPVKVLLDVTALKAAKSSTTNSEKLSASALSKGTDSKPAADVKGKREADFFDLEAAPPEKKAKLVSPVVMEESQKEHISASILTAKTAPKQEAVKSTDLTAATKPVKSDTKKFSSDTAVSTDVEHNSASMKLSKSRIESATATEKPKSSVTKATQTNVQKDIFDKRPLSGTNITETESKQPKLSADNVFLIDELEATRTKAAKIEIREFKEKEDKEIDKPEKIKSFQAVAEKTSVPADTTTTPKDQAAATEVVTIPVDGDKANYSWVKAKVQSFRTLIEEPRSPTQANHANPKDNKPIADEVRKSGELAVYAAKNIIEIEHLATLFTTKNEEKSSIPQEKASNKETVEQKSPILRPSSPYAEKSLKANKTMLSSKIADNDIEPVKSIFKDTGFGYMNASVKGLQVKVITSHEFFEPSGIKVATLRKKDVSIAVDTKTKPDAELKASSTEHDRVKLEPNATSELQPKTLKTKNNNSDNKFQAKASPRLSNSSPSTDFNLISRAENIKQLEAEVPRSVKIFEAKDQNADVSKASTEEKETEETLKNFIEDDKL